jgi:hypothetical protein
MKVVTRCNLLERIFESKCLDKRVETDLEGKIDFNGNVHKIRNTIFRIFRPLFVTKNPTNPYLSTNNKSPKSWKYLASL